MTTKKVSHYGMHYHPRNKKIVARAREASEEAWNALPVKTIPAQTPINAHQESIDPWHVDKISSGAVPFREGYVIRLWEEDGKFYVVDGHTRIAIYRTLNKPIPAHVMNEKSLPGE